MATAHSRGPGDPAGDGGEGPDDEGEQPVGQRAVAQPLAQHHGEAAGDEDCAGQEAQPGRTVDGAAIERSEIERGEHRHQAAGDAEEAEGDPGNGR